MSTPSVPAPSATHRINPLLRGLHAPNFATPFTLGDDDRTVLSMRGLDEATLTKAADLWGAARDAVAEGRALAHLKTLDAASLAVLQHAASLADPVSVSALSEEGAENLLLAPTEAIDRDHDGLVERGIGRTVAFPPPDAAPELRAAWEKTVDGLGEDQALMLVADLAFPKLLSLQGEGSHMSDYAKADFNWSDWIARLKEGVLFSAPYNTAEATRRGFDRLDRFLVALREQHLAV